LRKLYGLDQLDQVDESSGVSSKRKHEDDETSKSDIDNNKPSDKRAKTVDDEGLTALQTLAASDAKARETMLTRPFLLANWVKLRTYQHIGLNWLVSVQSRRLNGILAVSVESLIAFTFFVWFTF
jgi:SNF2 family DNA or RNA helicase